jgi:hypothetical protein
LAGSCGFAGSCGSFYSGFARGEEEKKSLDRRSPDKDRNDRAPMGKGFRETGAHRKRQSVNYFLFFIDSEE